jgi:DNA-binding NarL/FixJ family response regulator
MNLERSDRVRVLIVDDHAVVRRGIRALLEPFPEWEICGEASDGIEAVRRNQELRPDIIIMDISMPQLNGLEASRQILQETPQTEILLITLLSSEDLLKIAVSFGVRGYVLKSDAEQDLVDALRTIREHRAYVSPAVSGNMYPKVRTEGAGS